MNLSEIDIRLTEFIYDEYKVNSVFQHHGQYISSIFISFKERTGIDFEDAGAQLEAINRLLKRGWIETEPPRIKNEFQVTDKVRRPTPLGIENVENFRQSWIKKNWKEIIKLMIESIVRAFKRI